MLGDREWFNACVYTTPAGREQLRIAALVLAKAILGYDQDAARRSVALSYQTLLTQNPGALDLCIEIRTVWELGAVSVNSGTTEVKPAYMQLEAVAKNVYAGMPSDGLPWWAWGGLLAVGVGGGYYVYRRRKNLLPARS